MGKRCKDKKKGQGGVKTFAKTEKKLSNKKKNALGEDDIESIVAQIEKEENQRLEVTETSVDAPSRRLNFSFIGQVFLLNLRQILGYPGRIILNTQYSNIINIKIKNCLIRNPVGYNITIQVSDKIWTGTRYKPGTR